jgi:hypothetical protein
MHWTFFIECHTAVEGAGSTEEIQATGLAVVALVSLVYISLRQHQNMRANGVPLDCRPIRLEEVLLA